MQVLTAFAEFERDLLVERTQAGLKHAKAQGKAPGRPWRLSDADRHFVLEKLANGVSAAQCAREHKVTRQTIMRIRAAGEATRLGK